jgi:hypothetical protein
MDSGGTVPAYNYTCFYGKRNYIIFFVIPFYLQSVPVHSANCVKTYTMACRFYGKRNYIIFFLIPFYLQSVPVHSANCVKTYTMACRRVLTINPHYQSSVTNRFKASRGFWE